jgi:GrpB-like predicted nucleotidyltransferase (UPF0157 family)
LGAREPGLRHKKPPSSIDVGGLVSLSSYDPSWPARYEREAKRVSAALGDLVIAVEHIGSTSVPGLTAKPTIDILAGIRSLEVPAEALGRMADLGYLYRGELGIPGRRYFRKGNRYPRDFNVHVVVWGGRLWNDHLAFRDYLRAHPERARDYAELKRELLAGPGGGARTEYQAGKEPFIDETLRLAAEDAAR